MQCLRFVFLIFGFYVLFVALIIIQVMHGSECDIEIWWTLGWKCRMRVQPKCDNH